MSYANLENKELKVLISTHGAEMQSLYSKKTATEYLWQGNAAFWGRRAPHLFPIIGGLKDGYFLYDTQKYSMSNHGFARDSRFSVDYPSLKKAVFTLEEEKENYPFRYRFTVTYTLKKNRLKVVYEVKNTDKRKIYFSVGGHPAFTCPLDPDLKYSDYFIEFEKEESSELPLIQNDLVDGSHTFALNERRIPLMNALFEQDALVFERPHSKRFWLRSLKDSRCLEMRIKNFDSIAFWSKPKAGADFICFEPWCGIDDKADSDHRLEKKWKIVDLKPRRTFKCAYTITVN